MRLIFNTAKTIIFWYTTNSLSQVDRSGHRILQELAGKTRENGRILQENTGNQRNMVAVFRPEIFRIFSRCFPAGSCWKEQEFAGIRRKKVRKISGRNTATKFR